MDGKNELIQKAESLIDQIESLNENSLSDLSQLENKYQLNLNFELFNNSYNNFCVLIENKSNSLSSSKKYSNIKNSETKSNSMKYEDMIEPNNLPFQLDVDSESKLHTPNKEIIKQIENFSNNNLI